MTAIALVRTREGIVIGADGRRTTRDPDKEPRGIDDKAQKIFQVPSRNIAYAWSGAIAGGDIGSPIGFDLYAISREAANAVLEQEFESCADFVCEFCEQIYNRIPQKAIQALYRVPRTEPDSTAVLVLAGWVENEPHCTHFEFKFSENGAYAPIERYIRKCFDDRLYVASGSTEIWQERIDCRKNLASTVDDGARVIRDYINKCIQSKQPECCDIGGHLHIAVLDSDGFRWDTPPIEK